MTEFCEIHPSQEPHKMHVSYKDVYYGLIGGDEFKTMFKKNCDEANMIESYLRHVFMQKENNNNSEVLRNV
ncbi:hypothetical protein KY349_03990 [Candidatus Woesearchaeota archaeon]|nr:hypothetical protein [Candidatus Woesearchaeota archaeon]